jgi:ankyrin repeat protein
VGCAELPFGSRGYDPIRLLNAIVIDDVGYVRDMVALDAVTVDQRIPAPGYMEGTPLVTIAARSASLNVLRYLISARADVNARTPAGETSLMLAAYFHEGSASDAASMERYEAAVRILIAAGASLENDRHHYTPLAYAAYQGRERTLRYLLERGARVDADAENGVVYVNTPLMMASIQGHLNLAIALLRAGADPRIRIKNGLTARELAIKYRHASIAQTLACAENLGPGEQFALRCTRH